MGLGSIRVGGFGWTNGFGLILSPLIDHYNNASIVMERSVDIESLENTFILEVFK